MSSIQPTLKSQQVSLGAPKKLGPVFKWREKTGRTASTDYRGLGWRTSNACL